MTTLLDHPLSSGLAPAWAAEWGEDRFGVLTVLRIGKARQKLRYIPPGSFQMGSLGNEEGRWPDEGPQHLVKLSQGFWLADTVCTQELWQEVMGENPSRFKGPQLPVETVSWKDAQIFLQRLEALVPGCGAALPTEAQWEYACRAGTTVRRYGPIEEIAWYEKNSNGTTQAVAKKLPNAWGLFDTLGNVWEWSADYWQDSYEGASEVDPKGPTVGSDRVCRGGSWFSPAGLVRAAFRRRYEPGFRYGSLGFRFSLGQLRSGTGAERGNRSARSAADPGSGATS